MLLRRDSPFAGGGPTASARVLPNGDAVAATGVLSGYQRPAAPGLLTDRATGPYRLGPDGHHLLNHAAMAAVRVVEKRDHLDIALDAPAGRDAGRRRTFEEGTDRHLHLGTSGEAGGADAA